MDSNWRPDLTAVSGSAGGSDPIANPDWRSQLQPEARHRIVNKIMDTLKRHLPVPVPEGLNELHKIAVRFEEKIYSAATSQPDYLRKISLKMLSMETKTQGPQINPAANPNRMDPGPNSGLGSMQAQSSTNPAQSLAMPVLNQPPSSRQLQIPQNFQINSTAPQNQSMPAGTQPLAGMNSLAQPPAGMNSLAQSVGPTGSLQADMYANAQRRQQNQPQQNQTPQNQLYQQHQQNILRQKLHMQQQQQGLLQQSQMQMSSGLTGQSVAQQNSMTAGGGMQVQNNQLNPLQQQSLLRQQQQNSSMTTDLQQQQMQMQQNQMRQNQMISAHNMNNNMSNNMNNNMMVGAGGNNNNNNMANMQQRRMQQMNQQMQPQQNQNQQHLLSQFQNQQPMQQQQGGNNNNINNSNNINNNNNMMQLQQQQRSAAMLQTQHGGNNNNGNNNNGNNNNNMTDQQKQQFMQQQPQQRVIQDVASSPASMDSTAQTGAPSELEVEEAYQKLLSMREAYLTDLREVCQRVTMKLKAIDQSMVSDPKAVEQFDRMKSFKAALDRFIGILQLGKQNLNQVNIREKLNMYEKNIISILQSQKKIPQQQHQQPPPQQPSQPPTQQQQMPPAQQSVDPQQQFAPLQQQQQQQQAQTHQIDNHQMQGNFNMQNDQIQQNGGTFGMQNTINGMNPPQTVGTGTGTMMSHGNMMQQNLGLKQQQEAAAQQQQRLIQQNQIKQRHMQQLIQKQQLLQQQQHLPLQQQIQQQKQQQQQNNNTANNQASLLAAQLNNDSMADVKPRQAGLKPNPYQPLYPGMGSRTGYFHPQPKTSTNLPISSPQNLQSSSPQVSLSSPQIDQMKMERAHLQPASSPFIPSPSPPVAPSPLMPDDSKPNPNPNSHNNSSAVAQAGQTGQPVPTQSVQSLAVGTPGISASPLLAEITSPETANHVSTHVAAKSTDAETPIERLARALRAGPNPAVRTLLKSAITDINSAVTMVDRVAGSAPGNGSRAAIGDDLVAMTKCRMQARNLTGGSSPKRMKRDTSALPLSEREDDGLDVGPGSVSDGFKDGIEVQSTATSRVRMGKSEMIHELMEEIEEINSRLIDTELTLTEEESDSTLSTSEGTVIKCIYTAVAISPCLRSHFASSQLSPILPLRLLVPTGYPKCSPIILDKLPEEQSRDFDDLSTKARSRFRTSLRVLSEPLNLKEIARTWDSCARKVILEYAQKIGGGSFSTTYGTWKSCIGA